MKKVYAIHHCPVCNLIDGKIVWSIDHRDDIRVLATAEGYCMIRRPRASPYVCPEKEIELLPAKKV